jgi:hypothetical protein
LTTDAAQLRATFWSSPHWCQDLCCRRTGVGDRVEDRSSVDVLVCQAGALKLRASPNHCAVCTRPVQTNSVGQRLLDHVDSSDCEHPNGVDMTHISGRTWGALTYADIYASRLGSAAGDAKTHDQGPGRGGNGARRRR